MTGRVAIGIQAPDPRPHETGTFCCTKCGRGAGSAYRGDCLAPDRCPCHKAARLARLRARTGAIVATPEPDEAEHVTSDLTGDDAMKGADTSAVEGARPVEWWSA